MPRAPWVLAAVAILLLAGCATPAPDRGELPGPGDTDGQEGAYGPTDEITALATGLDTIWEIAFSPDGRIFLTERPGTLRVLDPARDLEPEVWTEVPGVVESGEAGLMGLALDPGFSEEPWVYVCHTYRDDHSDLANRIVRIRETAGGHPGELQVLLSGMDGSGIHDGCRLGFGPDGLLYATMGDAARSSRAQEEASLNGKVLRIAPDGSIPEGNPWDTPVFTTGHRNAQGLAFHPDTGTPYISEHGPENHDEVNVLVAGDNYGWPEVRGMDDGDGRYHASIWTSGGAGTVAPAGAAFVDAPGSPLDRRLLVCTLKAAQVHVLELAEDDPTRVAGETVVFDGDYGRLRACVWGPDGALYLSTSNKDGRGSPGDQDDRVIRVPLAALEQAVQAASG